VTTVEFPFDQYVDLTAYPGQAWAYQVAEAQVDLTGCTLTLTCPDLSLTLTGTVTVINSGLSDVVSTYSFHMVSSVTSPLLPGAYEYRISATFGANPPAPFVTGDPVPFGNGILLVLTPLT